MPPPPQFGGGAPACRPNHNQNALITTRGSSSQPAHFPEGPNHNRGSPKPRKHCHAGTECLRGNRGKRSAHPMRPGCNEDLPGAATIDQAGLASVHIIFVCHWSGWSYYNPRQNSTSAVLAHADPLPEGQCCPHGRMGRERLRPALPPKPTLQHRGGHGARADKELKLSFVGCGSIAIRSPISCFRLPTAPAAVAEAEDQLFVCLQMFDKIGGVRRPPGPSQTVPPGLGWGPNRLYVLFLIWIHMREIVNSFFKMDPYQNKIVNRFVDMDLDGLSVVL